MRRSTDQMRRSDMLRRPNCEPICMGSAKGRNGARLDIHKVAEIATHGATAVVAAAAAPVPATAAAAATLQGAAASAATAAAAAAAYVALVQLDEKS